MNIYFSMIFRVDYFLNKDFFDKKTLCPLMVLVKDTREVSN